MEKKEDDLNKIEINNKSVILTDYKDFIYFLERRFEIFSGYEGRKGKKSGEQYKEFIEHFVSKGTYEEIPETLIEAHEMNYKLYKLMSKYEKNEKNEKIKKYYDHNFEYLEEIENLFYKKVEN